MLTLSSWSLPEKSSVSAPDSLPSLSCAAAAAAAVSSAKSVLNVGTLSRVLQRGQQIPEAYRWKASPEADHECCEDENEELPVIDLGELLREQVPGPASERISDQINSACREWGAFQVINHGVDERVVERARSKALDLFSLPDEVKLRAERVAGTLFGYGATRMASFFNRLMWSEAFTMMGSPNSNISEYSQKLCNSINNNKQDDFCTSFEGYDRAMRNLGQLVIRLIFQGLRAKPEQIENTSTFWGMIHMNHYPPCPSPTEAMGLASHTDSSCLTIMHQGNVAGLQVKRGEKWIPVRPVQGAFVIQVGDMLQVMSNNEFRSVVHRAVVNDRYTRLSLVYFFTPPPSATVAPINSTRSLYRCLTWNEYLQTKAKVFMGALDHFLLPLHHF